MLKLLRIHNIILIEEAELEFEAGFTVLTGETGAGKSAILKALDLVLGARADSSMIRKGAERARVEAAFEVDDGELILRRDLLPNGKSRAYVDNVLVPLSDLRKAAENRLDMVGQHANQRLSTLDYHREVVDLFGGHQDLAKRFTETYQKEKELSLQLEQLKVSENERLRQIEILQAQLEEIDEANIQEGEEEELFAEYSRLSNAEELASKLDGIMNGINEGKLAILHSELQAMAKLDGTLDPFAQALQSASLELQETAFGLQSYRGRLAPNPARLDEVNQRLRLINQISRKYGDTADQMRQDLTALQESDNQIEALEKEISALPTDKLASELTKKRTVAAKKLSKALISHLHPLNMKGAQFLTQVTPTSRTSSGDDLIEFHFAPNPGEGMVPIRKSASGGELSRVLLALKTTLAGLELTPTLIFDEIDAAMGGATARLVGEKIRAISSQRQVICITHLPQVAELADHHFCIQKEQKGGRTRSTISLLTETKRELARMSGR